MKVKCLTAEEVARKAHEGQFRRDGVTPYTEHVFQVASFFEFGTKEYIVACLHDVLEDNQEYTAETLRQCGFDEEIIEAVVAITKVAGEKYEDYINRVKANLIAASVKRFDIFCNLSDKPTLKQSEKYAKALIILGE